MSCRALSSSSGLLRAALGFRAFGASFCPERPLRDSSHSPLPDSFSRRLQVFRAQLRALQAVLYVVFMRRLSRCRKVRRPFLIEDARGGVGGGGARTRHPRGVPPLSLQFPLRDCAPEVSPDLFFSVLSRYELRPFTLDFLPRFHFFSQMPLWRPLAEAAQLPSIPCSLKARTAPSTS